jgi:hypothetical protein
MTMASTTTPLYDEHGDVFAMIDDDTGLLHRVIKVAPSTPRRPTIEDFLKESRDEIDFEE